MESGQERVTGRLLGGAAWLVGARLLTRSVDLAMLLVLGRLLRPDDFGLVALAMTLLLIVEAVLELPVSQVLVRLSDLTKEHLDTAFTLSLGRGVLLGVILCGAAWPFAKVYGEPALAPLICALSLAPIARSLLSPALVRFTRSLHFWPEFVLEISGKALALVAAVSCALLTHSHWALAVATITAPVISACLSYVFAPYRPNLTLGKWRVFAGFVGWSTASQAVTAINWQLDVLILGRLVDKVVLGRFSTASNLAALPSQLILVQMARPLMAAFAMIWTDEVRLARAYRNSVAGMVALGMPAMVGLALLADPVIRLVMGEKWAPAAPILQWLALATVPNMFVAPFGPLVTVMDRTHLFLRLAVIEFMVKFPILIFAVLHYGATGAMMTRLVTAVVAAGVMAKMVKSLAQITIVDQLRGAVRPTAATAVMAAVVWYMEPWAQAARTPASLVLSVAAIAATGAVTYCVCLYTAWRLSGRPEGAESSVVSIANRLLGRHFHLKFP